MFRSLQETLLQAKEFANAAQRKQAVAQDSVQERFKYLIEKKTAYIALRVDDISRCISWIKNTGPDRLEDLNEINSRDKVVLCTYDEARLAYEASVKCHFEAFNAYTDTIVCRDWAEDGVKLVQDWIKRHRWTVLLWHK